MTQALRHPVGVLLMTFGSATTSAGVRAYMASVRGGGDAPDDIVAEFERRYDLVGRSPLVDITRAQATALEHALNAAHGGDDFVVEAGMLHSAPRIEDSLQRLREAGATRVVAVVLAPQYSPIILAGYERAIVAARARDASLDITVAAAWHMLPEWIDSLAERLHEALARLPLEDAARIPVIFTAHSLPRSVVERDPGYIEQLRDTARAVAQRTSMGESRWQFAYQSAGHTPEEWLRPDVKDLLPGLRSSGHDSVLIVPVQFLADHLEILYDLDIAAAREALSLGIHMHRIAMPNISPAFIGALAAVVERELQRAATTP